MFVNTFEVAWFIYGHYLFLANEESDFKKNDNLRSTIWFIAIWGYIVLSVYLIGLLFILLLLVGMWSYGIFSTKGEQQYRDTISQKEKLAIDLDNANQERIRQLLVKHTLRASITDSETVVLDDEENSQGSFVGSFVGSSAFENGKPASFKAVT